MSLLWLTVSKKRSKSMSSCEVATKHRMWTGGGYVYGNPTWDSARVVLRSHATVDRRSTSRRQVSGELTTAVPGAPELNGNIVVSRGWCGVEHVLFRNPLEAQDA